MRNKILVIDDDKIVCRAIKKELENEGYEVMWVLSGKEGVKMIEEDGFEIAIIDLILPDIDGVEVCKEIKRRSPYIKPFLMSGHMNELDERRKDFISSGGCKDVIIKPFNEGELARLARHVFKKGEC